MANDNEKLIRALMGNRHKSKTVSSERRESYYFKETESYRKKYFPYAHNVYSIMGQDLSDMPNSTMEKEYLVRIMPAIDGKTGVKHHDDWQELSFYETYEHIPLGMKFFFFNNVWIVFQTNNISPVITTAVVRRCNATLKRMDENGIVHVEPCVWDRDLPMQSRIIYRETNNIFTPEMNLYAQFNQFTQTIKTDDRFIFGRNNTAQAFKVKEAAQFILGETWNDDSPQIVAFSMERTLVSRCLDDIENGIANRFVHTVAPEDGNGKITFSPAVDYVDKLDKIMVVATLEGEENAEMVFSFSGVPEECYEVSTIKGNSFDLMCLLPYNKAPLKVIAVTEHAGGECIGVKNIWLRSGL